MYKRIYNKIFLFLLLSVLVFSLTSCSKDDNPYDLSNVEEGKFNDSGDLSDEDFDLHELDDPFIKKYISKLNNLGYEVLDVEVEEGREVKSQYGEEAAFTLYVKDKPEINIYRFDKDSNYLERIDNLAMLEPISNLGASQNAIVVENYVLATTTVTHYMMDAFREVPK